MIQYAKFFDNHPLGERSPMSQQHANIPMQVIGPIKIIGAEVNDDISVPLATYESPLWPSTNRGAKISRLSGGIRATIIDEKMTRSIVLQAPNAQVCHETLISLKNRDLEVKEVVKQSSRFARLQEIHHQVIGNLLFLRFEFFTGDAAGHNMVTKAADSLMAWLLRHYSELTYVSISGNYCTDKKASAVNGILGRGKYVVTEITIPREVCRTVLKTSPEKIVDLNIKKNLIGTMAAGTIRSANAHFANMLLGFYLATGQDAANIIEGSQGFVHAETQGDDLYFSATLPNLILGTTGSGKEYDFVKQNFNLMGCLEPNSIGMNARRLAIIAASTVLCGELSLLAAQTNPGELMRCHVAMERQPTPDKAL